MNRYHYIKNLLACLDLQNDALATHHCLPEAIILALLVCTGLDHFGCERQTKTEIYIVLNKFI